MEQKYVIFGIIAIVLIGIFFIVQPKQEGTKATQKVFSVSDTAYLRNTTFNNCQNLLNKTVNFEGKIIYEECGKNCLGGCPNSGPDYCYYGIQDSNQCVVYLKSRISSGGNELFKDEVFNTFTIGQTVKINGNITLYYSYDCDIPIGIGSVQKGGETTEIIPECSDMSYFIIGGLI